jgi:aspartate aminotransferase
MTRLSPLVQSITAESAFTVLAIARRLKAQGKDVVELEIGDSPFPSTPHAKAAGIAAIEANETGYTASLGLPEFRAAAARFVEREFHIPATPDNIVVASGAKPFETYFAEALLEPGDGVLIFSPHFPTYEPNLARRGARAVLVPLRPENDFRPDPAAVAHFHATDPRPRAVWLNFPHNPTGGVATRHDLEAIADVVRGTDCMIFSDEPYCHMVWTDTGHASVAALPGMLDQTVAAFTFSKSYSMSGWRIGFAVAHPNVVDAFGRLINTSASCSPPFVQRAAIAALEHDQPTRDEYMTRFRRKVERLAAGLGQIDGINVHRPNGTFYVFPDVRELCRRHSLTSQGLALYLLEAADDQFGIACLGGECFGAAGAGFLRFSCAEPDERIDQEINFLPHALERAQSIATFKAQNLHLIPRDNVV